jgi:hypothetical protein
MTTLTPQKSRKLSRTAKSAEPVGDQRQQPEVRASSPAGGHQQQIEVLGFSSVPSRPLSETGELSITKSSRASFASRGRPTNAIKKLLCASDVAESLAEMLNLAILKNPVFLLYTISNFITSVGYIIPYCFLMVG